MIQKLMEEDGLTPGDVTAIAVSRGPGSFTGVRIGMITAKALAQIWDKPIVAVPTLAAFAFHEAIPPGTLTVPFLDARRDQVYGGAWRKTGRFQIAEVIEEKAWDPEEFLSLLKDRQQDGEGVVFCGDGVEVYQELLKRYPKPFRFAQGSERMQQASSAAQLALELYLEGRVTDAFHAAPVYLRQSEAERKLLEKCGK
jgi:tRNA threonylcarbamoyladenosine biosynthesis protein TsaB